MAWALIIIGTILTLHGIIEKYREYKIKQGYSNKAEQLSVLQGELSDIEDRLNRTLHDLDFHRQDLERIIAGLETGERTGKLPAGPQPMKGDNFKNIISGKFRKLQNKKQSAGSGKNEKIINLARAGEKPEVIAEKMDIGVREVELILKLYQRKVDASV